MRSREGSSSSIYLLYVVRKVRSEHTNYSISCWGIVVIVIDLYDFYLSLWHPPFFNSNVEKGDVCVLFLRSQSFLLSNRAPTFTVWTARLSSYLDIL